MQIMDQKMLMQLYEVQLQDNSRSFSEQDVLTKKKANLKHLQSHLLMILIQMFEEQQQNQLVEFSPTEEEVMKLFHLSLKNHYHLF